MFLLIHEDGTLETKKDLDVEDDKSIANGLLQVVRWSEADKRFEQLTAEFVDPDDEDGEDAEPELETFWEKI